MALITALSLLIAQSLVRPRTEEPIRRPFRWRTALRRHLPYWVLDLGLAGKGEDCEAAGGAHEWYNRDGNTSGCYHCQVIRDGQLWQRESG
jgi:hypothetical protein